MGRGLGLRKGGRQFTAAWEEQMFGKQMFAMPCRKSFW